MSVAWLSHPPLDGLAQLVAESDRDPTDRARLEEVLARLAALRVQFLENVVSATADVAAHVTDAGELAGLSEMELERARARAQARGLEGYLVTITAPSYEACLRQIDDRKLRKQLFEARFTRASDRGPRAGRFDNSALVRETLELRHALAKLLGYRNYAELALRHDVFTDPDDAEAYLLTLHRDTREQAQVELDGLWAFAKEKGVPRGFSNWDLAYYADWMVREAQGFDPESLRPYFAMPAVLAGLWAASERLLGMRIGSLASPGGDLHGTPVFPVSDAHGEALGELELSVFAGPGELHGTQATVERTPGTAPRLRLRLGLEAPGEGEPTLLRHEEVEALFRCAGRGLALLAVGDPAPMGVRERHQTALGAHLSGSYLAQVCTHHGSLSDFARHHVSGEPLPRAAFDDLLAARQRHTNLRAAQALELSLFDLRIHRDYVPDDVGTQLRDQVLDTFMQVRREQSVLPLPYWTRLANTCLPLFAGDEAARLWHGTWADQVAAEVFAGAAEAGFSEASLSLAREALAAPSERLGEALASLSGEGTAMAAGAAP